MKPSGVASYLVQYRNKEGRTRRLVIGKVGTLAPDEARTLAGDALKAAAKGGDPSAERHAVRGAITLSDLCELYLADAKSRIKASTLGPGQEPYRNARQAAHWPSDGAAA